MPQLRHGLGEAGYHPLSHPCAILTLTSFREASMHIVGPLLAFVIAAFGAWGVITVATSAEGAPGCALPVFGFWGICFLGLSELWVIAAAFVGMGVGALIGVISADTS
jgi:hypothetical protein